MKKPIEVPIVEITGWDYDDGSVGGHLDAIPEGKIWAMNEPTLHGGIAWIMEQLIAAEHARRCQKSPDGMFNAGMQGLWIDGEYVVRWLPVVGFGVAFHSEELLKPWLKVLLEVAIQAVKEGESSLL